jgi:hypothetical protein
LTFSIRRAAIISVTATRSFGAATKEAAAGAVSTTTVFTWTGVVAATYFEAYNVTGRAATTITRTATMTGFVRTDRVTRRAIAVIVAALSGALK